MATAKKPMTLRAAVKACDLEAVQAALERLGDNAKAALDATDGAGRTMLHTCAVNANKDSAGDIARLLVDHGAGINAADLAGQVPLAIAVSVSIELPEESNPPALKTVSKLLDAGASVDVVDEWRSESGPLATAAKTPAGDAVCALLQLRGAELPWLQPVKATSSPEEADSTPAAASCDFDPPPRAMEPEVPDADQVPDAQPMSSLEADCAEHNIPFVSLGSCYAEEVLRECVRWQKTSVKELRQECQSKTLSTAGCVEKGDLISRLREACVYAAQKKASEARKADASADPAPESKVQGEASAEDTAEEDCDPYFEILQAAERVDLASVRRMLEKVRRSEGDSGVEDLVLSFDADANTPIHKCVAGSATGEDVVEADMEQIVDMLIEAKADVNAQNFLGESPLLSASRSEAGPAGLAPLGIIRSLLAANADPECVDTLAGETSLMEAACRGDVGLCRLLVDAKADLSRANSRGVTALDMAVDSGQADDGVGARHARAYLRGCGASRGEVSQEAPEAPSEKLSAAVRTADIDAVQDELNNLGRDVDAMLDAVNDDGWTLLHMCAACAAEDGAGEIARLLIEYGAAVDVEDIFGQVPLALAVGAGIEDEEINLAVMDVIRVLLFNKASVNSIEEWRSESSALASAASSPSGEAICKLLMAFGMDFPWCTAAFPSAAGAAPESPEPPVDAEPDDALEARCDEQGIPLEKLDRAAAADLLCDCDRWRGMSVKELRNECKSVHVPTDGCVEKSDLVSRLRQVAVWHAMPDMQLRAECKERSIAVTVGASHDELEDALLIGVLGGTSRSNLVKDRCKAKGIPVDLFESSQKATEVLKKVEKVESSSIGEIKKQYSQLGMEIESGMEKSDMVSRLRSLTIWAELSEDGLKQLCKQKGVPPNSLPPCMTREDLIKKLAEVAGIPVPASRHKNFFSFGNQPDKSGASQTSTDTSAKKPRPNRPMTEEEQAQADWEARAEFNRQQFAKGNRNHAGMPGGMRGSGGAAFRGGPSRPTHSGQPGGQRAPPRPSAPSVSTHFTKLGLPPTASMNEVRKVYRKLALQYHPDKNPGPLREAAEKKFQEVQASYDKICEHFRAKEGKKINPD